MGDENGLAAHGSNVIFMNVPFMRETLPNFSAFVFNRSSPQFGVGSPYLAAHRGLYGSHVDYLGPTLSVESVTRTKDAWNKGSIHHFHGLRPHDYLRYWLAGECEPVKCFFLFEYADRPYVCGTIQIWARGALRSSRQVVQEYCLEAVPQTADICMAFFEEICKTKGRTS